MVETCLIRHVFYPTWSLMFTFKIQPRFSETDALGHINNTVVPVWFESARAPVFEIFNPNQDLSKWNLILAKIEVNYLAQMEYTHETEIHTYIAKIGRTSFTVLQQVWQAGQKVAEGECVLVKFDYPSSSSIEITADEKSKLLLHTFN